MNRNISAGVSILGAMVMSVLLAGCPNNQIIVAPTNPSPINPSATQVFCPTQIAGTQGSGNTQFNQPNGAAVYGAYLYVTDYMNGRVEQYDTSLNWHANFGVGQLNGPGQVAMDAAGNLYVTSQHTNQVFVYNPAGANILTFGGTGTGNGQFSNPIGIAVDSAGNIYVSDFSDRVQKFTSSGAYITKWGTSGSGNAQFNGPTAIAIDGSNNVYVADCNNQRVEKFDSSGNYLAQFGSNGTGLGQFSSVWGITVGPCGNIYASDRVGNRIEIFTPAGAYVAQDGTAGTGSGQFNGVMGVAFDSSNNLYTTEYLNNRLQKFTPCGLSCAPPAGPTPEISACGTTPANHFLDQYPGSASLSNYTFFPFGSATPTTAAALHFAVNNAELQESSASGTDVHSYVRVNDAQFSGALSDYTVEADFKLDARTNGYGLFGIEFLEQSNARGYIFQWNGNVENNPPHWQVEKDSAPSGSAYAYIPPASFGGGLATPVYTPGNWVHLKVAVSGGGVTFNCYVNLYDGNGDQLIFSNMTDTLGGTVFTSGGVGFRGEFLEDPNMLHIRNYNAFTCP